MHTNMAWRRKLNVPFRRACWAIWQRNFFSLLFILISCLSSDFFFAFLLNSICIPSYSSKSAISGRENSILDPVFFSLIAGKISCTFFLPTFNLNNFHRREQVVSIDWGVEKLSENKFHIEILKNCNSIESDYWQISRECGVEWKMLKMHIL